MKALSIIVLLSTFLLQLTGTNASAAEVLDIRPLSLSREALKPVAYTADERELMAKQALMFIENFYVHRELKIADFGAQVDPVPRLEDMVRRAASLSDADFHTAMQKIFLDLHDFHTNYIAPMPLRCSYILAPLRFKDVYGQGTLKVIVAGKSQKLKDLAPEVSPAEIGDELVALNGKPIRDVLAAMKKVSGGANNDAMVTSAIMNLSMIALAGSMIPADNELKYTLKHGTTTYEISSKYFALINNPSCVEEASAEASRPQIHGAQQFDRGENPLIRDYKKLVLPPSISPFSAEETLPIGEFSTLETPAGKLLKFDLTTFLPEGNVSPDELIHQVKAILQKNQESVAALIIDMRSNGGGSIALAEGLTQLFTPKTIETMPVRLLPNEINLAMFLNSNQGQENGWSQDVRSGISVAARYTKLRTIISAEQANRYGQIWFKPVVILTDANCYSACDLFAAAMQDHGGATIIGTHETTGAGGANVMDYDTFKSIFTEMSPNDNPFLKLPGSQQMRVSWRQTVRVGKNKGQLIEDSGVKSDIVVRNVTSDVVAGESRALMTQVRMAIEQIIPRYKSSIQHSSSLIMNNGAVAKWQESVVGVDSIEVLQGSTLVESIPVNSVEAQEIDITLANFKGKWSETRFQVVGKLRGVTQFRVNRKVLWRGAVLSSSGVWKENFSSGLKYWHALQSNGEQNQGWQTVGNVLRIGQAPNYQPNIVSQVFAAIDTEGKESIALDLAMSLDTEGGMDFVNVIIRNPETGDEEYLASLSGSRNIAPTEVLQIPVNGAKRLEVIFEFTSDENWHMKGPQISKLSIATQ